MILLGGILYLIFTGVFVMLFVTGRDAVIGVVLGIIAAVAVGCMLAGLIYDVIPGFARAFG